MPQEVRVFAEGTLRWVQASGSALTWQTASAPISGLVGFVQAGFSFNDINRDYATIMDRGVPSHHKLVRTNPIEARFTVMAGVTADYPDGIVATASGTTTRQYHLEFRQNGPEGGGPTAIYYQLHHIVTLTREHTEQEEGNQLAFSVRALSAIGPTGSGYLS